jgi:hypothetical protein
MLRKSVTRVVLGVGLVALLLVAYGVFQYFAIFWSADRVL